MSEVQNLIKGNPIIPVLAFKSADEAVAVCTGLYEAGIKVLEITLRHETALDAIEAVAKALPDDAIVGAGTVLSYQQAEEARKRGAVFGVSPGLTLELAEEVTAMGWPFLPGVATLSEAMRARELGFTTVKFFPAEVSGGIGFLKAVGAVLPDMSFCPTGGITGETAANYLALKNVFAVGGSWLTERDASGTIDLEAMRAKAAAIPSA